VTGVSCKRLGGPRPGGRNESETRMRSLEVEGEGGGVCGTECGTFMCTVSFTPSDRRTLLANGCEFEREFEFLQEE
jgi:hypothetical protein